MFGFSPGKLLVFILLIAIVWIGFRYVSRVDAIRRSVRDELKRRQQAQKPRSIEAEDLVKCAKCSAYVSARSGTSCGQANCPWGR